MDIQLQQKYLTLLTKILKAHLNKQQVYVFGSRAVHSAKKHSDIDICLVGDKLSFQEVAKLKDVFSESDLPYFVDIVQKASLSDDFYASIEKDFIELTV